MSDRTRYVRYYPPSKKNFERSTNWARRTMFIDKDGIHRPYGELKKYEIFDGGAEDLLTDMAKDTGLELARATLEVMFGQLMVSHEDAIGLMAVAKAIEVLRKMEADNE